MFDFHTHILPGVDDGSMSAADSVEMLKMLKEQGVSDILLTPHFYAHYCNVEEFLENRRSSLKELLDALKDESLDVKLYLGCEALYFDELWRIENLKSLCIEGTDCILVELPFSSWQDSVVEGIERLVSKGITPVIAHFDRYLRYKGNLEKIYRLVETGALLQLNCNAFENFFTKIKINGFLKKGLVFALGTDCHNLTTRKPDYLAAAEYIKKKIGQPKYARFVSRQKSVLKNAKIVFPADK